MLGHRTLNTEDYWAILKRRWWIICVPAVVIPVIAVGITYFVTPKYESTSLILIDQQKVSSDVVRPMDIGDLQSRLALINARIESRSTLDPIIAKYNLYATEHLSPEARAMEARKNLAIATIESQIGANGIPGFKVTFIADDPRTAQEVCAEITGLYTQNNLIDLQNRTVGTTEFVQSELNESKRKLDDMDQKLAEFQQKNMGALPGDEAGNSSLLGSLSTQLESANNHLQQLDQAKQIDQTFLDQASKASTPAAVSVQAEHKNQQDLDKAEADLTELLTKYGDDYPDVKAAKRHVDELRAQIAKESAAPPAVATATAPRADSADVVRLKAQIQAINLQIDSTEKDEVEIKSQMRTAQGRISSSPVIDEQYKELTRDYGTEQANYNQLRGELNQSQANTEMQNRQEGESFSMLDAASLPIDPTFPKQSVFALGGLAGGIALGVLIIAFLEYRDTAMRNERDIWAFTQLPTLAVIAYSEAVSELQPAKQGFFKRLFTRKPKEALAG